MERKTFTQVLSILIFYISLSQPISSQSLTEEWKSLNRSSANTQLHLLGPDSTGDRQIVSIANRSSIAFDEYVNAELRLAWSTPYDVDLGLKSVYTLTVANMDDDASEEVLVFNNEGTLFVFDSQTKELERKEELSYRIIREMQAGDFNRDGRKELIVMEDQYGSPTFTLLVLDYQTFDTLFQFQAIKHQYFIVKDSDNNGFSEIYYGKDTLRKFDFYDETNSVILDRLSRAYIIEDLDNDGNLEMVISNNEGIYIYNFPNMTLRRFRPGIYTNGIRTYAINVDTDPELELFFVNDSYLKCYDVSEDRELWGIRYSDIDRIVVHDFEGDGKMEFVHTDDSGNSGPSNFYIRDVGTGELKWQSPAFIGLSHASLTQVDEEGGLELVQLYRSGHRAYFSDEGGTIRISDFLYNQIKYEKGFEGGQITYLDMRIGRFLSNSNHEQIIFLEKDESPDPDHFTLHLIDNYQVIDTKSIPSSYLVKLEKGNFDQDDQEEIVVLQDDKISFYNIEDDRFSLMSSLDLENPIKSIHAIDVDGDGVDEIVLNENSGQSFHVLKSPSMENIFSTDQYRAKYFTMADLDGNGQSDFCILDESLDQIIILNSDTFEEQVIYKPWDYTNGDLYGFVIAEMDSAFVGDEILIIANQAKVYNMHSEAALAVGPSFNSGGYISQITALDYADNGTMDFFFGNNIGIFHLEYTPRELPNSNPIVQKFVETNLFTIIQNPVHDQVQIRYKGLATRNAIVSLWNLLGKQFYRSSSLHLMEGQIHSIKIPNLAPSSYIVTVEYDNSIESFSIIKND